MARKIREVLPDMTPRLEAARREVDDAVEQLALARARRDRLVVRAVDEGMEQKAIARAAGMSAPHVIRILTNAEPDALIPH